MSTLLQRRTSSLRFIPQIDGVRFYAVAAVLLFHCTAYLMTPAKNPNAEKVASTMFAALSRAGHSGVELFFVISGFILGLPFAKAANGTGQPVSLYRYFLRRLVRLEPPYIFNLLVMTAAILALGRMSWPMLWPHLLASLTYTHGLIYGEPSAINFVAWSLEIEVQFYILAPLMALVFRVRDTRARRVLLWAGALISAFTSCILSMTPSVPQGLKLSLACFLQYFLVGFLIADWYACGGEQQPKTVAADVLAFPCVAAAFALESVPALRCFVLPLAFAGLCFSALKGVLHSRLASATVPVVIGGMCYTIYLYHPAIKASVGPLIVAATPAGLPIGVELCGQLAAFLIVITGLCLPLFVLLERPFMGIDLWERQVR